MFRNRMIIHTAFLKLFLLLFMACHTPTEYDRGIRPSPRPVMDIDGNVYETINIDDRIWMAENLRATRYRNGDPIANVTTAEEWETIDRGALIFYNNISSYDTLYGKLYNWYAINDPRGLCPPGWRVPTERDWVSLINVLGGESLAGGKMKARGTQHWRAPNVAATNESGFTGLPGGMRRFDGVFTSIGEISYWWSSTETGALSAWSRGLYYSERRVIRANHSKNNGFSVRCVRVN